MYYYELFSHSDRFSYRAHLISSSTCVFILCISLTFLSPFLLTYYTGDFWLKESYYSEQPNINSITKYIIIIGTNDVNNNQLFTSSYYTLNRNFQESFIPGSTTSSSYDTDNDGLLDQFIISFDLIFPQTTTIIRSINIWLVYQYELSQKQHITMETMALISIVPPSQLNVNDNKNITTYGQLIFEQRNAIPNAGNDSTYNTSIFDIESIPSSINFDSIINQYLTRNYYTSYQTQYTWITPRTTMSNNNILTFTVVVNNGRQLIRYIPGFWQSFKWGWIQYISVLLPFIIVFNRLKLFVFSNNLVRTLSPLPDYRHKA